MRSLEEADRRALIMWSIALCVGSLLLAPLAARSSIDVGAQQYLESRDFQLPEASDVSPHGRFALSSFALSSFALSRDPFSADTNITPEKGATPAKESRAFGASIVGTSVRAGDALGIVLPPNTGALDVLPAALDGASVVAAIITGDRAQALVYEGERSRILSIGDRLEGHRILSISADGVKLDDGSTRRLAEGHQ